MSFNACAWVDHFNVPCGRRTSGVYCRSCFRRFTHLTEMSAAKLAEAREFHARMKEKGWR